MKPQTLLYRQVNESWLQLGIPSSQTFRPTPKDNGKASVYDGDIIGSAEASYRHWTEELMLTSVGVLAVTEGECTELKLPAFTDGILFSAHATIDFTGCKTNGEIKRLAGDLTQLAFVRGWQHRPGEAVS